MTLPELIIRMVVVAAVLSTVGVRWQPRLAFFVRNWTALALAMSWCVGQLYYLFTGNNLPVEMYLYPDIAVIAIIMAKHEECTLAPYRSTLHQLSCMLLERSPADRLVLLIFPLMWLVYCADMGDFHKWWSLWGLVIVQFVAAGIEAFHSYRRSAEAADTPPDTGALLFAYLGGRTRGYG